MARGGNAAVIMAFERDTKIGEQKNRRTKKREDAAVMMAFEREKK
jgi:hypothetical protein